MRSGRGSASQQPGQLLLLFRQKATKEIQLLGIGFRGDQSSKMFDVKLSDIDLHGTGTPFALALRGVSDGA
jgi:hypothetical protein